ncbi:unnamed protein product [Microthlaspi erraticum]|uniref:Uncharacterized protein n=1 Tax=Microthlaspi erraticum TaxID=1685480 RepID=A0A6D2JWD7_9BRAS|nr:unnamed protein product [Microthlaspi erraticum]
MYLSSLGSCNPAFLSSSLQCCHVVIIWYTLSGLVMVKGGLVATYSNGPKSGTNLSTKKRKRWREAGDDGDAEDDDELCKQHVTGAFALTLKEV